MFELFNDFFCFTRSANIKYSANEQDTAYITETSNTPVPGTPTAKYDSLTINLATSSIYTHGVIIKNVSPSVISSLVSDKQDKIPDLEALRSLINSAIQPGALNSALATKQDLIENFDELVSGAEAGSTAVQPGELTTALSAKQDTIADLSDIRKNAAAGATAVQPAAMAEQLDLKQNIIDDLTDIRDNAAIGKTSIQNVSVSNGQISVIKAGESANNYNILQSISENDGSVKNGVISIKTNTPTSATNKIATVSDIEDRVGMKWADDSTLIVTKGDFTPEVLSILTSQPNNIVFDNVTHRVYLGQENGVPAMFGADIIDISWDNETKTLSITDTNESISNIVLSDSDSGSLLSTLRADINTALVTANTLAGTGAGSVDKKIQDKVNALQGTASIASSTNGIVTIKVGIVETNGIISNSSDSDITLNKIASTGSSDDLTVVYDNNEQTLTNALTEIKSQIDAAASAGTQYIKCTVSENTPSGISANNGSNTWTGSLAASASTTGKVYLSPTSNTAYTQYITTLNGSNYIWTSLGSTEVSLDGYVKSVTINGVTYNATGINVVLPTVVNTITGEVPLIDASSEYISVSASSTITNGVNDIALSSSVKTVLLNNATDTNNGLTTANDVKNYVNSRIVFREWTEDDMV